MATIYVTEYNSLGGAPGAPSQTPFDPPVAAYSFAITGSSTTPGAPNTTFKASTNLIRVHTDAICSIAIGLSPTAAATATRLAANQTEYHSVAVNQGHTIAVITNV
jgi:hypothetical protein